jgi:hypothetical protein
MKDDEIAIQFVFIPEFNVYGRLVESNNYYCIVEFELNHILHRQMFDEDDVIYLKEINIPIEEQE